MVSLPRDVVENLVIAQIKSLVGNESSGFGSRKDGSDGELCRVDWQLSVHNLKIR